MKKQDLGEGSGGRSGEPKALCSSSSLAHTHPDAPQALPMLASAGLCGSRKCSGCRCCCTSSGHPLSIGERRFGGVDREFFFFLKMRESDFANKSMTPFSSSLFSMSNESQIQRLHVPKLELHDHVLRQSHCARRQAPLHLVHCIQ